MKYFIPFIAILTLTACTPATKKTITGKLSVVANTDSSLSYRLVKGENVKNCSGDMLSSGSGFSDIQQGAEVSVKDGNGKLLALGKLDAGEVNASITQGACEFRFAVNEIPQSDFYVIKIGSRGEMSYSAKDMESKGWDVELSLNQ